MTQAEKYRARADQMEKTIKRTNRKAFKENIRNKQTGLRDLADNEDWLDGKASLKPAT